MKTFLLFSGNIYYPSGGARDFCADFDSINNAKAAFIPEHEYKWAHIAELREGALTVIWCAEYDNETQSYQWEETRHAHFRCIN